MRQRARDDKFKAAFEMQADDEMMMGTSFNHNRRGGL